MTLLAVSASASASDGIYLVFFVIGSVIAIITALWGGVKLIRKQAAEEARQASKDEQRDAQLAELKKLIKPNGLNTEGIGDIAKRTEIAVRELASKLDQHMGAEKRDREDIWNAIERKQDRVSV